MKTFKSFLNEAGPNAKPKAKGEADFVAAHKVEITDKEDQATDGSAKVTTKNGSGKRKADRLDNKQAMGEDTGQADARKTTPSSKEAQQKVFDKHKERMKQLAKEEVELTEEEILELDEAEVPFTPDKPKKNPGVVPGKHGVGPSVAKHLAQQGMQKTLRQMKRSKGMKEEKYVNPGLEKLAAKKKAMSQVKEADFNKQQTKMAHTIGKEFEKKGVGDETRGGPYAVASAMVRDKPEAAKKAYATIQSKMKEDTDAELLFKLYNDLNEDNQEFFMQQLEEDADSLLEFARMMEEE
jgi:hypothetical protein